MIYDKNRDGLSEDDRKEYELLKKCVFRLIDLAHPRPPILTDRIARVLRRYEYRPDESGQQAAPPDGGWPDDTQE